MFGNGARILGTIIITVRLRMVAFGSLTGTLR
jgi:hypothetical protein